MDGAQQEEVIGVIPPPQKVSYLRRRNSTVATPPLPTKLTLPSKFNHPSSSSNSSSTSSSSNQSFATVNFELVSIKPASYTSLRDILPSSPAAQSPTPSTAALHSGNEISIRNRLVKQAAWAYLRPMSTSTESEGRSFIHLLWTRFSVFIGWISRTFDQIFREIRIRTAPTTNR